MAARVGEAVERRTEITTVALKTAYLAPLLPRSFEAAGSRDTHFPIYHSDLPVAALAAAEPAVVPVVIYGETTPLMSPWDESWRH